MHCDIATSDNAMLVSKSRQYCNQQPSYACQRHLHATAAILRHTASSSLHIPELTHKHPQAFGAPRAKPTPNHACAQPASYSRSQHPSPRPDPVAAAHTPSVLPHRHDQVPSRRCSAQHSQPQPTHDAYDPMQSNNATSNHAMLVSDTNTPPQQYSNTQRLSSLHIPELTHKHPQAFGAPREKPTPNQPASYSRSQHPSPHPDPVAAADTLRVLPHWHDEVPSR
jgi:hypothetical protein